MSSLKGVFYTLQNALKVAFLVMSVIKHPYTVLVASLSSLLAILRVQKMPQFNKYYLQKVLMNNHGQNLLYIGMASFGTVNYLFYAPITVFFIYSLAQYYKLKLSLLPLFSSLNPVITMVISNKFYFYEGRGRLQLAYFFLTLFLLPVNFSLYQCCKLLMLAQYLFLKYQVNLQFQYAVHNMDSFLDSITKPLGFINSIYKKIRDMIAGYARSARQRAQASQRQ